MFVLQQGTLCPAGKKAAYDSSWTPPTATARALQPFQQLSGPEPASRLSLAVRYSPAHSVLSHSAPLGGRGFWEGRGVGSDWLAEEDDVAEGGRFVSQLRFTHPGSGLVLRPGRGLGRKRKWRKDAGVGTRAGKPGVRSATPVLPPPLFLSSSGRSGPAGWRLGSGDERARGTPPSRVHAPVPVVFPTRTISTCPSTSRPASCSVGEAPPRGRLSGEAC